MNLFIKRFLTFVLFSAIFYLITLILWAFIMPQSMKSNLKYFKGSYGHLYSRLDEAKKIKNVDLLFLGSSHAYRGFDTRIFKEQGINSFNLGSSAQTPIQTKILLERYLDSLNPKLIIYEVYPLTFNIDGIESSLDLIANDNNDFNSILMSLKSKHITTFNTMVYALFLDIFSRKSKYEEPIKKDGDTYISGGFVEKKIAYYKPINLPKEKIKLENYQLESFKECLNLIKKTKTPLILVYAPIAPSDYNRFVNNHYFDSLMTNFSTYYNFNEILDLNDSLHFYDSHHLNQNGVELFNRKLIETLKENGHIKN